MLVRWSLPRKSKVTVLLLYGRGREDGNGDEPGMQGPARESATFNTWG